MKAAQELRAHLAAASSAARRKATTATAAPRSPFAGADERLMVRQAGLGLQCRAPPIAAGARRQARYLGRDLYLPAAMATKPSVTRQERWRLTSYRTHRSADL
jgi:hypothetical protein